MKLDRLCTTIHNTEKLRDLILENPDLPLVVFAGEEANGGDYTYVCCTDVRADKGEILDCAGPNDELIYTDRDELEDDVSEELYDEVGDIPDDEYDKLLRERLDKYEEYWVECILVYVNN